MLHKGSPQCTTHTTKSEFLRKCVSDESMLTPTLWERSSSVVCVRNRLLADLYCAECLLKRRQKKKPTDCKIWLPPSFAAQFEVSAGSRPNWSVKIFMTYVQVWISAALRPMRDHHGGWPIRHKRGDVIPACILIGVRKHIFIPACILIGVRKQCCVILIWTPSRYFDNLCTNLFLCFRFFACDKKVQSKQCLMTSGYCSDPATTNRVERR